MKYIINTIFKRTKNGGNYYCSVYEIGSLYFTININERVAKELGCKLKRGYIKIPFGSGTGYNRIARILGENECDNFTIDL